ALDLFSSSLPSIEKIAGREALDLFSSSLPSIEKSPVEKQKFYSCRPHKFAAPGPGLVGLGVNPALIITAVGLHTFLVRSRRHLEMVQTSQKQ
ncbi:hypothetical protein NQ317_014408, partial [Molorchus minor]